MFQNMGAANAEVQLVGWLPKVDQFLRDLLCTAKLLSVIIRNHFLFLIEV